MGDSTAIGNHTIERYSEVESASRMDFSYLLAVHAAQLRPRTGPVSSEVTSFFPLPLTALPIVVGFARMCRLKFSD